MAKTHNRKTNGSIGGRPSIHSPKTERLGGIVVTPDQRAKARKDAKIIGCSESDAIGSAIDMFDAGAYKRGLEARKVDT